MYSYPWPRGSRFPPAAWRRWWCHWLHTACTGPERNRSPAPPAGLSPPSYQRGRSFPTCSLFKYKKISTKGQDIEGLGLFQTWHVSYNFPQVTFFFAHYIKINIKTIKHERCASLIKLWGQIDSLHMEQAMKNHLNVLDWPTYTKLQARHCNATWKQLFLLTLTSV